MLIKKILNKNSTLFFRIKMSQTLKVLLMSKDAIVPSRGSQNAAGLDLYSARDLTIAPKQRSIVFTDIQIELPPQTYGKIASRSGLAAHHSVDAAAGTIDGDYRGNIGVLLVNNGDTPFQVTKGQRIAQLIIINISTPQIVVAEELTETLRQNKGFGSSGK